MTATTVNEVSPMAIFCRRYCTYRQVLWSHIPKFSVNNYVSFSLFALSLAVTLVTSKLVGRTRGWPAPSYTTAVGASNITISYNIPRFLK